MIYWRRCL